MGPASMYKRYNQCDRVPVSLWLGDSHAFHLHPRPEVIKLFFILYSGEHEIYPAHKC